MLFKSKGVQTWARRLHIYVSMALLAVTLFFALTGITLNRPELFERSEPIIQQYTLTIPSQSLFEREGNFQPNRSALLDFLIQEIELRGTPSALDVYTEVENRELVLGELSLDFKGPGYNATVFVDMTTGETEVETTNYGIVALLNDLHKGRNSGDVWKWLKDLRSWWRKVGRYDRERGDAVTSATRPAGQYRFVWDGTNDDGQRLEQGDYTLHVEVVREHGGRNYLRQKIQLADKEARYQIKPTEETGVVTVNYQVK
ncbi:PepSY-associated TM helix domain-containing protein [Vibrio sp. PNB22_8_1]|uniref:PepSY-associated TM helix domain-containing protein n=1 Tax=unclassified Vibrio TaxID=2614977 RepID=UPI00406A484A